MKRKPIHPDEAYLQLLTERELHRVPSISKAETARVFRMDASNLMRDFHKMGLIPEGEHFTLESVRNAVKKRIELIRTLDKLQSLMR